MTEKFQPDQKVKIDYTDAAGHRLFYEGRIVRFETNLKLWRVDIGSVSIAIPEENIHER